MADDTTAQLLDLVRRIPAALWIEAYDDDQPSKAISLYCSPHVEQLTGFGPNAWSEDPELWLKVIHPEDQQRVATESWQSSMDGGAFSSEFRILHRDGRTVHVREIATVVRDDALRRQVWYGLTLDVGDRAAFDRGEELGAGSDT